MSNIAIINDNNNFAPPFFRSLCAFVGHCFGPRYFSSGATLPQKNTSVQHNHLRFHTMTSKKMVRSYYCLNNRHLSWKEGMLVVQPRYQFHTEKNIKSSKVEKPCKEYIIVIEPILLPHLELITGSPTIPLRVTPAERFINLSSTIILNVA